MVFQVPLTNGFGTTYMTVAAANGVDAMRACANGPHVYVGKPKYMGWWLVIASYDGTYIPWFDVTDGNSTFRVEVNDPSYAYLAHRQARVLQEIENEIDELYPSPPDDY